MNENTIASPERPPTRSDTVPPKTGPTTVTLPVIGMSCAACAVNVEGTLRSIPGIQSANVNFANKSAFLSYDPAMVELAEARQLVQDAGYDLLVEATPNDDLVNEENEKEYRRLRTSTLGAFLLSVAVVICCTTCGLI